MKQGKFRKKPVIVDAFQWNGEESLDQLPDWFTTDENLKAIMIQCFMDPPYISIRTLEGTMHCQVGDYIIRGVKGEIYPCKPDIFEETYEQITVVE